MSNLTEAEKALLNRALTFRRNSLAAYVLAADPFLADDDADVFSALKDVAAKDGELAKTIEAFMEAQKAEILHRPHEPFVSELNYLSLKYLAKVVKDDLTSHLRSLEEAAREIDQMAVSRELLNQIIAATKEQVGAL